MEHGGRRNQIYLWVGLGCVKGLYESLSRETVKMGSPHGWHLNTEQGLVGHPGLPDDQKPPIQASQVLAAHL